MLIVGSLEQDLTKDLFTKVWAAVGEYQGRCTVSQAVRAELLSSPHQRLRRGGSDQTQKERVMCKGLPRAKPGPLVRSFTGPRQLHDPDSKEADLTDPLPGQGTRQLLDSSMGAGRQKDAAGPLAVHSLLSTVNRLCPLLTEYTCVLDTFSPITVQ